MMNTFVRVHRGLADHATAAAWAERLLPIAERLGSLEAIARGLSGRGSSLAATGRPREGIILLRGAHQLALAHDLSDVEGPCRIIITFLEQWGDPAVGLQLGREGLEIGRRLGSRQYGQTMVGNTFVCALRVGDWDWAAALVDEWLELATDDPVWFEMYVDRALLSAHRGLDPTADLEASARLRSGTTDPQNESYELYASAVWSLASGEFATAIEHMERCVEITAYFAPLAYPLAARAALWNGDADGARRFDDRLAALRFGGQALEADRTRTAAGIAALEGRPDEALAGFGDALRAYRRLGLSFEDAATAVDMAGVLPGAPDVPGALETLTRLGAQPYVARLTAATRRQAA
jgi:tetratricopeptide (TPR) repeat protein